MNLICSKLLFFLLQKAEMMFFAFFAIVILHLFPFPMRPLQ